MLYFKDEKGNVSTLEGQVAEAVSPEDFSNQAAYEKTANVFASIIEGMGEQITKAEYDKIKLQHAAKAALVDSI